MISHTLAILTFHSSVNSCADNSVDSIGILITKNLSRESPPSWKPGNKDTVMVARSPGFKHPTLGRTRNFSGEVVFICHRNVTVSMYYNILKHCKFNIKIETL